MKLFNYKALYIASLLVLALTFPAFCLDSKPKWPGVDEVVIEKYAEAAGRPSRAPFINTDQGDLLLFCFLIAGAIGGFVAGYSYRSLVGQKHHSPTPPR